MKKSFPLTSSKASQVNFVAVTRKKTSLRTSAVRHILHFILRSFSVHSPFILRSFSVHPPLILRSFSVRAPFNLRSFSVRAPFGDRRTIEERSKNDRRDIGESSEARRRCIETLMGMQGKGDPNKNFIFNHLNSNDDFKPSASVPSPPTPSTPAKPNIVNPDSVKPTPSTL